MWFGMLDDHERMLAGEEKKGCGLECLLIMNESLLGGQKKHVVRYAS